MAIDPIAATWTIKLRRLVDPALICYFNNMRGIYVVDRCVHPESSSGLHKCTTACVRTNVLMLEPGEEPSDNTISTLKGMDVWAKYTRELAAEKMLAESERMEAAHKAEVSEKVDQLWKDIVRDDERTLRQAHDLIQRHDMGRIH